MKKIVALLLAVLMLMSVLSGCSIVQKTSDKFTVERVAKHGNLVLKSDIEKFVSLGYACGDVINVEINGKTYEMPVGDSYSDVDVGKMICRLDYDDDEVSIAINQDDFATVNGLATKESIEEDPGYKWTYNEGVKTPIKVYISMKEKEGYLKQYNIRSLERSNEREDYPDLSDEDFANFRMVKTQFMAENLIYRSSTPIDADLGRNEYADAAAKAAGVKYVINMHNEESELSDYEWFEDTYVSTCDILCVTCDYDYPGDVFRNAMKESMQYILNADGPVLIHCKEGKDRTGILCALIEGLCGASYDDIREDYIKTYENFYGINENDEVYELILKENLFKPLCNMLEITDPSVYDLREEITAYLVEAGMTESEVQALETKLSVPLE